MNSRIRRHSRFASRYLSTPRDLVVYLPPDYEQSTSRYPVFYLQDGQNLFDPATAFGGQDWRADQTADELIQQGSVQPLIMVGIYNTGVRRVSEYTPTRDPGSRKGGKADRYAQMLAREIKPFIDREYRTLKPASQAALGGSSLGGIVSLTSCLKYPGCSARWLLCRRPSGGTTGLCCTAWRRTRPRSAPESGSTPGPWKAPLRIM